MAFWDTGSSPPLSARSFEINQLPRNRCELSEHRSTTKSAEMYLKCSSALGNALETAENSIRHIYRYPGLLLSIIRQRRPTTRLRACNKTPTGTRRGWAPYSFVGTRLHFPELAAPPTLRSHACIRDSLPICIGNACQRDLAQAGGRRITS